MAAVFAQTQGDPEYRLWQQHCQCLGPYRYCQCIKVCECGHRAYEHDYDGAPDGPPGYCACEVKGCECARFEESDEREPDEREKGDDDGREYADPRDELEDRLRDW